MVFRTFNVNGCILPQKIHWMPAFKRTSSVISVTLVLLFIIPIVKAQQPVVSDSITLSLVHRIAALQVTKDSFFSPGMFQSFRQYRHKTHHIKPDDNIFFTAIGLFTLKSLKQNLPATEEATVDTIINRGVASFSKYRNAKNQPAYNFWQTDTPSIFPNSGFLHWFSKSNSMPDDADDTVMILMALGATDSTARATHALMQQYANLSRKKVKNTFKEYRSIGAYSTWFGNKMPVDFDVCVLANVLYFVKEYQLPLQKADSASIELLRQVIINKHHLDKPAYISPHYNRSPIIIYHLARLLGKYSIPILDSLKPQLIGEAKTLIHTSDNFLDKVILNTALIRLGTAPETVLTETDFSLASIEQNEFCFFIGDIATYLPNFFRKPFAKTGLGKFYFYAPAYNDILLLEYLVEQHKYDIAHSGKRG